MLALGWWFKRLRIMQDCKEFKVEMYKPICDLVLKCNNGGI
jgi:hypothetical protein